MLQDPAHPAASINCDEEIEEDDEMSDLNTYLTDEPPHTTLTSTNGTGPLVGEAGGSGDDAGSSSDGGGVDHEMLWTTLEGVAQLQRRLEVNETEYRLVDKTRVKGLQTQPTQECTRKLEDTLETLRIFNSLQKSLKMEEYIKRRYELKLQHCRAEIEALRHTIEEVVEERNQVVKERNKLAVKAQQEFDRAEQLQRIVTVLRKKTRSVSISSGNT